MAVQTMMVKNLTFDWSFESGSLLRVGERSCPVNKVSSKTTKKSTTNSIQITADYNISLWLRADCEGTEFQNNFRTWFYFSVKGWEGGESIRFHIENMNRQIKLFSMGYTPLVRLQTSDGTWVDEWQRIPNTDVLAKMKGIGREMTVQLGYKFPPIVDDSCAKPEIAFFAFTYPYNCTDLQSDLNELNNNLFDQNNIDNQLGETKPPVFVHIQQLGTTLMGRPVELITISDWMSEPLDIDSEHIDAHDKPFILITARVHPGETNSSYVMRGILRLLLDKNDQLAQELRNRFVFLLVPMLNPDGVALGCHRTDIRGINLNRVFDNPSMEYHAVIAKLKSLIVNLSRPIDSQTPSEKQSSDTTPSVEVKISDVEGDRSTSPQAQSSCTQLSLPPIELVSPSNLISPSNTNTSRPATLSITKKPTKIGAANRLEQKNMMRAKRNLLREMAKNAKVPSGSLFPRKGLAMYLDLHGHVSKPGVFLYGNYFKNNKQQIENLVFTRTMTEKCSPYFVLDNCVFSKANMFQKDKLNLGYGKEGSGRVAIHNATGLTHCYTIECNYYGGMVKDDLVESKYEFTPKEYEEVGYLMLLAILDYGKSMLDNPNPNGLPITSNRQWAQGLVRRQRSEKRFRRSRSRNKNDENKFRRKIVPLKIGRL